MVRRNESVTSRIATHIPPGPQRDANAPARCRRGVGDTVRMEYVSRVPRPPLDGLIDDIYHLEGAPPYPRLTLPRGAAAFRIRAGTDIETGEYADRTVLSAKLTAIASGSTVRNARVGVHFKPWGLAPF